MFVTTFLTIAPPSLHKEKEEGRRGHREAERSEANVQTGDDRETDKNNSGRRGAKRRGVHDKLGTLGSQRTRLTEQHEQNDSSEE